MVKVSPKAVSGAYSVVESSEDGVNIVTKTGLRLGMFTLKQKSHLLHTTHFPHFDHVRHPVARFTKDVELDKCRWVKTTREKQT